MVVVLRASQLIQQFLEYFRAAQPLMDVKPGTVARDLFIDFPSLTISQIYDQLARATATQSFATSIGSDLENLASNFNIQKLQAGRALGPAVLTFATLTADISIPIGSFLYARNGVAFRTVNSFGISTSNEASYRSLATKYRTELDAANISDEYAVEAIVECTAVGQQGNIPKYSLISSSIPGISNVTNVVPFVGGSSGETDSTFRNRAIAVFSGSNTGTELGYKNLVATDSSVIESVVIGPGDSLMLRDGTIVKYDADGDFVLDEDGNPIILSEGTSGKVDIFVRGIRLTENVDSFVYTDKSGQGDPTDSENDFVIGQLEGDENRSIKKRRLLAFYNKTLSGQPVYNIVEVTGNRSGSFAQEVIDEYGNSTGNFSLLKDTGVYSGSSFGFDKLHWVSNYTQITDEEISKSTFNAQDPVAYSDVTEIEQIKRTVLVTNENSLVSSLDRSELTLLHIPIRNITKVLNVTTGERYVVSDRNPGGSSSALNTSGKIKISGKTLPSVSDVLQLDYEWIFYHDPFADYDSFIIGDNPRQSYDSVDWGYSNAVRREQTVATANAENNMLTANVALTVDSVISVNKVTVDNTGLAVTQDSSGYYLVSGVADTISNVVSVKRNTDNAELYTTRKNNGYFQSKTITLPLDTVAKTGDIVTVVYNAEDLFTTNGISGSFSGSRITMAVTEEQAVELDGETLEINYIANVSEVLPSTALSDIPVLGLSASGENTFNTTSKQNIGLQPVVNVYSGTTATKNLKKAPSRLAVNMSGIVSPGTLAVRGAAVTLCQNIIFQATHDGLKQNLSQVIKTILDVSSLSSDTYVGRIISVEKVEKTSNDVVTSILNTYEISGYELKNPVYVLDEAIYDTTLSNVEFRLPSTVYNSANSIQAGDSLRITFYILKTSDTESLMFSTNGTIYTNKSFATITSVSIASGFRSGNTTNTPGSLTITLMNQPGSGTRFRTTYKFTSPKPGERITIRYNQNSLIKDSTLLVDQARPITADVLVREKTRILVDVVAEITVLPKFKNTKQTVAQNVADAIANAVNGVTETSYLDSSDLVNAAYQISGLDSIRITRFNESDKTGSVLRLTSLKTQYLVSNSVKIYIT